MKNGTRNGVHAHPSSIMHQHPDPPGLVPMTPAQKADHLDILEGANAFGMWVLLVRPAPNEEKSPGGIILPEAVRERPTWIVHAIGEKVTIPVKVGDHVAWDCTRVMEDARSGRAWAYAMEGQIMGRLNPALLANRIITTKAAM